MTEHQSFVSTDNEDYVRLECLMCGPLDPSGYRSPVQVYRWRDAATLEQLNTAWDGHLAATEPQPVRHDTYVAVDPQGPAPDYLLPSTGQVSCSCGWKVTSVPLRRKHMDALIEEHLKEAGQ